MKLEEWKKANPNRPLNEFYSEINISSKDDFAAEMLFGFDQQKITDIRNAIRENDVDLAISLMKRNIPLGHKILDHINHIQKDYEEKKLARLHGTISDEAQQIAFTTINFSIVTIATGIQRGDEKELEKMITLSKKSDKLLTEFFQLEKTKDQLQLSWAQSQNSFKVAPFIRYHSEQEKVFPSKKEAQVSIIIAILFITFCIGLIWGLDQMTIFSSPVRDSYFDPPIFTEPTPHKPNFFIDFFGRYIPFIVISLIMIITIIKYIDFMNSVKVYEKAKVNHQQTLTELDRKINELKEALHIKN